MLSFLGRENVMIGPPSLLRDGPPRDVLIAPEYAQEIINEIKVSDYSINKIITIYPEIEVYAI